MNKCKGKCPTLAVIKTTNGYIFGGYTTQLWIEDQVKDQNAFVFSIDKKKKYNIKYPEYAIGFENNYFWIFGYSYNTIVCHNNCTKTNDNYVDNKTRCAEIFEDDFFLLSFKQYSNENINEQKMSSNLFFLLENAFNMGDNKCKEIIINNFTYFLLERIKVLSEFIIKEQYVSSFNIKCKLLLSMIYFLEINVEKYSEILSNLIFFLHTSNLEEILIKVETNAKNYDKIIIPELLLKLKPNQK